MACRIPRHPFWTCFFGVFLIVIGMAIILDLKASLAALVLGVVSLLLLVLLHVPRAIADPYSNLGGEWSSVFQALAFSGVAFIIAGGSSPG